jgi:predicted transcriptional regulator
MRKLSISLTDELDDALESIAIAQGMSKSRVIENFLREHKVVQHYIEAVRAEPATGVFALSRKVANEVKQKSPIPAQTSA